MSKKGKAQASAQIRRKKRGQRTQAKGITVLPVLQPNTAGVDIGATEIYVAVPADRDPQPVRRFDSFTGDLQALADWLKQCGTESIAMESTGVYWIPLFQILEERGFQVCLVNARHFQNVPGKRTDVADCQWLQYLHSVGLLRSSFRPEQAICAVRTLLRHRNNLIEGAAKHVLHMEKALEQMNLKLHHVISDLTGVTGLAIVDAILAGNHDPAALAKLCDRRIRASEETIVKSLEGDYRPEHLITLRQSLELYRDYQKKIAALDGEMEAFMAELPAKVDLRAHPLPEGKKKRSKKPQHNAPAFDLRSHCYRLLGVDLTEIPGLDAVTAHVLLTEVGPDFSAFSSGAAFASWLGLCPNHEISGGKVLARKTRKVSNRLAHALRNGAQNLHASQSSLGQLYRRLRTKLGAPKAITAAAHKLARIIYAMVTTGRAYDETLFAEQDKRVRQQKETRLRKQALDLGFQLVPVVSNPA